jgi:hypothetical protein
MKIKDIISEASITIPPWTPSNPSLRGPSSQIRVAAKTGTDKVVQAGKIQSKKVLRFLASDRYRPYITSKSTTIKNGARFLRIWQFLGFGEMILDFIETKAALEIMKGLPEDDPSHISQEEYDTNWRQALEILAIQILASEAFPRLLQAMKMGKWLVSIMGFFGTVASWGTTLAIFVASELAMLAFQKWLMSPEGKKSLSYIVVYCVDPLATWLYPESLINKIKELAGVETKKPDDKKPSDKKPDDKKTDTGQAGQPKPQGQIDTTIPTANVPSSYVGNPDDLMKRDEPKGKFAMNI